MTKRKGENPVNIPGGKAAARLRQFEEARGLVEAKLPFDELLENTTQKTPAEEVAGETKPKKVVKHKQAKKQRKTKQGATAKRASSRAKRVRTSKER